MTSTAPGTPAPTSVPRPAESDPFAVSWDDPAEAAATWTYDPMHFPKSCPLLMQDVLRAGYEGAFGLKTRFVNGYSFVKDFSPPPPTPDVLEKGAAKIWTEEFAPYIANWCRDIRSRDYDSMSALDLANALPGYFEEGADAFKRTMVVVFAFMGPTLGLVEFAEHALGEDGPMLVAELLQGYANETASAGSGLADLATLALANPEVASALRAGSFERLGTAGGGQEFLRMLEGYLEEYGWRAPDWCTIDQPTWAEDRRIPLSLLQVYVTDPSRSPTAAIRRSRDLRAAAEAKAAARLTGEEAAQFNAMVQMCRSHVAISEGRAHWQLTIFGSVRVPVLALGRKLVAANAIEDPNDAFYLSAQELQDAAANPNAALKTVVANHKADLAAWSKLAPPPFLGAPPSIEGAPPEAALVFRRFFGLGVEPSTEANVINGNAASSGVVSGRARIIRDLAEGDAFEPGEILVCMLTAPPWTPLFAIASAVVTETGGLLSHSAICAREYAIPCVVGASGAMRQIRTGDLITVDGDRGLVTVHP